MIQFTDERMRKLIKEETEKFLNSPYDKSFDLVLNELVGPSVVGEDGPIPPRRRQAQDPQIPQYGAPPPPPAPRRRRPSTRPRPSSGAPPVPPGATPRDPMDEPDEPRRRTRTRTSREEYEEANPDADQFGQQDDDSDDESWMDKLKRFNRSDANIEGGEAVTKIAKNVGGALKGLGYGAAKLGADATVGALGTAGKGLGALYRGLTGKEKPQSPGGGGRRNRGGRNQRARLQDASERAEDAGLDARTIMQLARLYRSGAMDEKQIATLKLMERCLKSGKVKVIKEDKDPIIIDV